MNKILFILFVLFLLGCVYTSPDEEAQNRESIEKMVFDHAHAWKTGDLELLDSLLHEDVIFAYPGRRLNKVQTLEDLEYFRDNFVDTQVYINEVIIDGDDVAVEWQFATTDNNTGERQVVSDGIIGKVKDGKIIVWKEYLDGRVKTLQASGELEYEEGQEPFPFPKKK
jgi:ketosteroid isomerase-like protein